MDFWNCVANNIAKTSSLLLWIIHTPHTQQCGRISTWTLNIKLMVALKEKLGDHQSQKAFILWGPWLVVTYHWQVGRIMSSHLWPVRLHCNRKCIPKLIRNRNKRANISICDCTLLLNVLNQIFQSCEHQKLNVSHPQYWNVSTKLWGKYFKTCIKNKIIWIVTTHKG